MNWVFEADIRKFYDSIDHEWLMRMVEHRIADPRVLRLIRQWLAAGVLENGVYAETVEGTPQGAGISPLLANIFLHYALDQWVGQRMRRAAIGRLRLVRELCGKVGDDVNQAADLISATASIPSLNFIPLTTFGNWF